MKHRRTLRFARAFRSLPAEVQEQAHKAFLLFQEDLSHPELNVERIVGSPGVWSGRISRKYRWTFHFEEEPDTGERICVHRFIGSHEDVYREP